MLIRDFRCLHEVVIDFSVSPIVSIVGDNESGKSSVIKAIQTIGANLDPNRQKDYIKTGSKGFQLAIKFADEDETTIVREKSSSFNSFKVLKGTKLIWETSKMDSSEVPPEVQKYMGFVIEQETRELLNVRTYEDLMLFIHTSGSTNYKVMYNALKIENLQRAKRNGQLEINELKKQISSATSSIETLTDQVKEIKLIDTEPLIAVRDRVKSNLEVLKLIDEARENRGKIHEIQLKNEQASKVFELKTLDESLLDKLKTLESLKDRLVYVKSFGESELESLEHADEALVAFMMSMNDLKKKLETVETENLTNLEELSSYRSLDASELDKLSALRKEKDRINQLETQMQVLDTLPSNIDDTIYTALDRLKESRDKYINLVNKLEAIEKEIVTLENKIKSSGVLITTCRNCGNTVFFDGE